MVTDLQVRRLRRLDRRGTAKELAAAKAGLDPKTARKYRRLGLLPSEVKRMDRDWRTRPDPFAEVWPELHEQLTLNPGLEAKTLFAELQRRFPGRFADGQLRTLQRKVKQWRALHGPAREVFFDQVHYPGRLCASDFTHCTDLGVTISGTPFVHLIYHFVLTYSNWEAGSVCFAESYESLSEGLQNALHKLGGVPQIHRTDRLTAAVPPGTQGDCFTGRYRALLEHYGLHGQAIQAACANENGDVEQRHHRFKKALEQTLLLRGSRDFGTRTEYEAFLEKLFEQLNSGRKKRLVEELPLLRPLPATRQEACKRLVVRVDRGSTIHVEHNVYSVNSRLIGERVQVRLYAERLEVWYAQRCVEQMPRLRGRGRHRIEYRHVIDWLVRKPGAFADYRYHADLFPSSVFRQAYDVLRQRQPARASKEYLGILHLAARESESGVEAALRRLLDCEQEVSVQAVREELQRGDSALSQTSRIRSLTEIDVPGVDLGAYDELLEKKGTQDEGRRQGENSDNEASLSDNVLSIKEESKEREREATRVVAGQGGQDEPDNGRQGDAGAVPEGTVPAAVPVQLRGVGLAGATGDAQLRALPAEPGRAGVPGAEE
jgi:hypothetical protein